MDGDLLSIAFTTTTTTTTTSSSSSSSLIPSKTTLSLLNSLIMQSPSGDHLAMDYPANSPPPSDFLLDTCHQSKGYLLEDVLSGFCSKRRRRLLPYSYFHHHPHHTSPSFHDFWEPTNDDDLIQECFHNLLKSDDRGGSEEEGISEDSSSSSRSRSKEKLHHSIHDIFSSAAADGKRKTRGTGKLAYPFAMVKSGGCEGDLTLNDINKRILMPPTRAVRHPVGDYACRPIISPEGPGLSGKAVVAFTRIHTQGNGTITIIRTRE